jgi:hypothetical protein
MTAPAPQESTKRRSSSWAKQKTTSNAKFPGAEKTHRCKAFYKCLKCCVLLLPFVKACIHRVRNDEVDPAKDNLRSLHVR